MRKLAIPEEVLADVFGHFEGDFHSIVFYDRSGAIDREALVGLLLDGQAPISQTFIPPDDVKWDWVKDAVVQYPFDQRRAHEHLQAAGWRRGSDGGY